MSFLGCFCFFSYFFFFLDESFYQLVPYHQIDQTVKSLGLPVSKIGPIIHNHCVCLVTDNAPLGGWPSKCDGKSPGTRSLLPKQKYLLKFFGVCVCFKFGEMLSAENRKSHTNKTGVLFCQCRREGKLSDSVLLLVCTSFSLLKLAVAGSFYCYLSYIKMYERKEGCLRKIIPH